MILLVHILFGAAIGKIVQNISLAIILAFLSHYLLDLIPHIDYRVTNMREKQWQKALPDVLKVFVDLSTGFLLVFLFSANQLIVYISGLSALIPDGLTFLNYIFSGKILKKHYNCHQKIHFLKNAKISIFWRILSQVLAVALSVILLNL